MRELARFLRKNAPADGLVGQAAPRTTIASDDRNPMNGAGNPAHTGLFGKIAPTLPRRMIARLGNSSQNKSLGRRQRGLGG